ncbi:uncharacterized protein JCM6883_005527 [Sporobolomyces salmoneus]|uniref:uncharacterized protein n=1 Tax=Sporobolomyces salmoneus TaxID=183962 RepID=UPI00317136FA
MKKQLQTLAPINENEGDDAKAALRRARLDALEARGITVTGDQLKAQHPAHRGDHPSKEQEQKMASMSKHEEEFGSGRREVIYGFPVSAAPSRERDRRRF